MLARHRSMTEAPQNLRQIEVPKVAKNPIKKVKILPEGLSVSCDTWLQKLLLCILLLSVLCTENKFFWRRNWNNVWFRAYSEYSCLHITLHCCWGWFLISFVSGELTFLPCHWEVPADAFAAERDSARYSDLCLVHGKVHLQHMLSL